MITSERIPDGADDASYRWTTILAATWGLVAALAFFNALLITHEIRSLFAAAIGMTIVWATLERKRWGRLALLGMSATTLGLFGLLVTLAPVSAIAASMANTLFHGFARLTYAATALAITSGVWLRRPDVVVEFDKNKRSSLAGMQGVIACTLVVFWTVSLVAPPPVRTMVRYFSSSPSASVAQAPAPYTTVASRIVRSAASANNR